MNQKWAIFQNLTCQSCEEIKQNDIFQIWKTGDMGKCTYNHVENWSFFLSSFIIITSGTKRTVTLQLFYDSPSSISILSFYPPTSNTHLSHVIIHKPNLKSILRHPGCCQVICIAFPFRQFSTVVLTKDEVVSLTTNPNPGGPGFRVSCPLETGKPDYPPPPPQVPGSSGTSGLPLSVPTYVDPWGLHKWT